MSMASACGGTTPSAWALPTYGATCFGSVRVPVNYVAGATVQQAPFVRSAPAIDKQCCMHQTSITSCQSKGMSLMQAALPTPKTWRA